MQTQLIQVGYQKQIASLFRAGKKLTVITALREVGTLELRHFVAELKKAGMDIRSEWKIAGNGKRFKEYRLNAEQ